MTPEALRAQLLKDAERLADDLPKTKQRDGSYAFACGSPEAFKAGHASTHELICELAEALEKCKVLIVEDKCDECGTFQGVRYDISVARIALEKLRQRLEK